MTPATTTPPSAPSPRPAKRVTPTYDPSPGDPPRTTLTTYRLLAFFLGSLGVHNYVAGHTRKATLQLALGLGGIVLTPFLIGLPILLAAWAWALVDLFTVTDDARGVPMGAPAPAPAGEGSASPIPSSVPQESTPPAEPPARAPRPTPKAA